MIIQSLRILFEVQERRQAFQETLGGDHEIVGVTLDDLFDFCSFFLGAVQTSNRDFGFLFQQKLRI